MRAGHLCCRAAIPVYMHSCRMLRHSRVSTVLEGKKREDSQCMHFVSFLILFLRIEQYGDGPCGYTPRCRCRLSARPHLSQALLLQPIWLVFQALFKAIHPVPFRRRFADPSATALPGPVCNWTHANDASSQSWFGDRWSPWRTETHIA